jgi:methionyl-tRNA synthetase
MKPTITYPDFDKLDLRVGKVTAAEAPAWSEKLLQFTVDFGEEIGEKTILSGVKAWFSPDDFVGNHYAFVVNLAERKMGEGVSQGMMLMADENGTPIPFAITSDVKPGQIIR